MTILIIALLVGALIFWAGCVVGASSEVLR